MKTLYDYIFLEHGTDGRVYLMGDKKTRYSIHSFSIADNFMKIFTGAESQEEQILPHLHDVHVPSLTDKDLETLAAAQVNTPN